MRTVFTPTRLGLAVRCLDWGGDTQTLVIYLVSGGAVSWWLDDGRFVEGSVMVHLAADLAEALAGDSPVRALRRPRDCECGECIE